MNDPRTLTRDFVPDTHLMHLYLRLDDARADIMIYNPLEDNSLIYRHCSFDPAKGDALPQLENFIYDNPLLLGEFAKTIIITASAATLLLPAVIAAGDTPGRLLAIGHPETAPALQTLTDPLPHGAAIAYGVRPETVNFMRRTFPDATLHHPYGAMARSLVSRLADRNSSRMLVNLRPDALDIITATADRLLTANTYSWREPDDALYYIMAVCRNTDPSPTEIHLTGDTTARDAILPRLRDFHPYVMPLVFPSELYRAGAVAMTIPYDLVIQPLACE